MKTFVGDCILTESAMLKRNYSLDTNNLIKCPSNGDWPLYFQILWFIAANDLALRFYLRTYWTNLLSNAFVLKWFWIHSLKKHCAFEKHKIYIFLTNLNLFLLFSEECLSQSVDLRRKFIQIIVKYCYYRLLCFMISLIRSLYCKVFRKEVMPLDSSHTWFNLYSRAFKLISNP